MKRIRIERSKRRRDRWWLGVLPVDLRDPDILRAKAIGGSNSSKHDGLRCHDAPETRGRTHDVPR